MTGWDPSIGVPGLNGSVGAFAVFDDGSGPALNFGGDFTLADEQPVSNLARYVE